MLELIELEVVRGGDHVVRGLTVTVEPGRVFWVIGPNGAGKSSLLRVLAGLDRPRRGRVTRRGRTSDRMTYLHSEMRLPSAATAGDWDRLSRLLLSPGAATVTPLWPQVPRHRSVRRLSTGEQKRLVLDVAIRRPGSLILDEPFEHLSPDAKRLLGRHLKDRARRSVVVVATNQAIHRAADEGGLYLDAGEATPIGPASDAEVAR